MSSTHGQTRVIPTRKTRLRSLLTGSALTGLLAWWDAERDIYTDTGLTARAINGDAVAGWKDQGSSAYHVTQSTAGDRPLYRAAALNGKPGVEFVSSDFLIRTGLSGSITASLTTYAVYCVFATTTAGLVTLYSEGNSGVATPFVSVNENAGQVSGSSRDGAAAIASVGGGSGANNNRAHIVAWVRNSATSWDIRLDGVSGGTSAVNVGASSINQVALGVFARVTNSQFYVGHLFQAMAFSVANYATIEPILKAYYNIP